MTFSMSSGRLALGAAVAGALLSSAAEAAIVTYTDRAAWLAAIGGATGAENFNGFVADVDFDGSSVALASGMTLGTLAPVGELNVIRTPPQAPMTVNNIDGTAYASMLPGGPAPGVFPFVSFGASIAAFGADFRDLNDDAERTALQLFDGGALLATLEPTVEDFLSLRFWGFAATGGESITEIRFVSLGPIDAFGMDNIEIATSIRESRDVPEPASVALLGLGLCSIGLLARRRRDCSGVPRIAAFALALGCLFATAESRAATLLVNGSGILTGAQGVNVNGTLYDVEFLDGTCGAVFSGCASAADFAFTTQADALAAAQALLAQVALDGPLGNFDTQPELTSNCGSTIDCLMIVPYAVTAIPGLEISAVVARNNEDEPFDFPFDSSIALTTDFSTDLSTWARFTVAVAVPEPGTVALLGAGLLGLAGLARPRRPGRTA